MIKMLDQSISNIEEELIKLRGAVHEYEAVLRFYASRAHWMARGEEPDLPVTIMIAGKGADMNGWAPAEAALAKFGGRL